MGDSEITSTSKTSPLNPGVDKTLSSLLGGIDNIWGGGPATFESSLYGGVGDTTRGGWQSQISAASNPAWYQGVDRSMGYTNNLISGGGLTGGRSQGGYQTNGQPMGGAGPSSPMVPAVGPGGPATHAGSNIGVAGTPGNLNVLQQTGMKTGTDPGGNPGGGQWGDLQTTRNIGSQYGELGGAYSAGTPGVDRLRSKLQDDTLTGVNSIFGGSGRLGSSNHMTSASEGLGNALAGFDRQLYQDDINNQYRSLDSQAGQAGTAFGMEQQGINNSMGAAGALSGLYDTAQKPGQTLANVGTAQDADKQANLLGRHDLFRRQQDAKTDLLAKLSSILQGTAGVGGSTTTQTSPGTPWWQTGIGLLGQFV